MTAAWVIIPARGGSKGVVDKNLRRIQGRSLVARAVAAARGAKSVARVFVSTDSPAIAAEATGAEILERSVALSGDTVSTEAVLLDALDRLAPQGLPDLIVLVQCTSPFVSAQDIDGAITTMIASGADTAHSVAPTHGFLWRQDADGLAQGLNHDKAQRPRRQDMEAQYLETGAVYVMRTDGFRKARHRFFGKTVLHIVDAQRALEIDTLADLETARLLAPALGADELPFVPAAIAFDFDGVMTDDRVIQNQDGSEAVICSRSDGHGIGLLRAAGIPMTVLSRETNPVVAARCAKLGLSCQQGLMTKEAAFRAFAAEHGAALDRVFYVGNDVNDLECLALAGLGIAVADAHHKVLASAGLILSRPGGRGAVRELADMVLQRRGRGA